MTFSFFPSEEYKWAVFMDECVMLVTKIMVKEKRKENFVSDYCVLRWATMRMREWNLTEQCHLEAAFMLAELGGFELWVGWQFPLCAGCVVSTVQSSATRLVMLESWFVADNYRWIYLDFLLGVVKFLHGCWCKELEVGPWSLSFPSCLCCVHGSELSVSWVLHLPAEGRHLL